MRGWLLRLCPDPTPHRVLPSFEDTFAAPTDADRDHMMPLLDVDLSRLDHGIDAWPSRATVVLCPIADDGPLEERGQPWASFSIDGAGKLRHDIPDEVFFDEPLISDAQRERFAATEPDPALAELAWKVMRTRDENGGGLRAVDEALGLEPGTASDVLDRYGRGRLALGAGVEAVPVDVPDDRDAANAYWYRTVSHGRLGVGILAERPVWTEVENETPTDADGKPMVFIGQVRANGFSMYLPGFVLSIYWSPGTRTFTQIDVHD